MSKIIGVTCGKYAPLHTGHIYMITKAATMCDELHVILSYDEKFFDNDPKAMQLKSHLTKEKRLLWLKTVFKDMPHIHIHCIDESDIPPAPEGVVAWCALVNRVLMEDSKVMQIDRWFSSEPEYSSWIVPQFRCQHVLVDQTREHFDVSGTKIRQNPFKQWQYMPSIVRSEFVKRVLLIGQESTGKTTLTRSLAKMYNTSWTEEYGRVFCEQDMCMDESLLDPRDYIVMATRRYDQELHDLRTANKVLFVDTNALITQYYHALYYKGTYNKTCDALVHAEMKNYDLILNLQPDVRWVADGLRSNNDRNKSSMVYDTVLDHYGIKTMPQYHAISGDYEHRFAFVLAHVNEMMKQAWNS